ncbi:MAG: GLPGLI family protein [Bergeyella sp.]
MRNITLCFLFCFSILVNAQKKMTDSVDILVRYELKYQYDSLDVNAVNNEVFVLYLNKSESLFSSYNLMKKDSVLANVKKGNTPVSSVLDMKNTPKTKFNFRIFKDFKTKNIEVFDRINLTDFVYSEKVNINWKISKESAVDYKGYRCYKATGVFGGRTYTAVYTDEIPISDGPYKFMGLPGLILKIYDDKNHYVFDLISLHKTKFVYTPDVDIKGARTEKKSFFKGLKDSEENIVEYAKALGSNMTPEREKSIKERMKKRNNPIELIP